jgi:ADP-ribosylglycohydrolase/protein-tyrosine phosphatase
MTETSVVSKPIPNCYWVIPGRLLAGEYPGAALRAEAPVRVEKLLAAGVTSFIDLTAEDELPSYESMLRNFSERPIRYRRWPITDHSVPESAGRMADILDYLDAELAAGQCVYVHCRAGIGRTGTTIACHLIRSGLPNEAALARLQELWQQCGRASMWPSVPETEEQRRFVLEWRDRAAGSAGLERRARCEGALVGLAIGDALGTLVATGAFDAASLAAQARELGALEGGADTAMARAVLESLLACGRSEPGDQLQRYWEWSKTAVRGVPPELKRALGVWQWSKRVHAGSHDPKNLDPHPVARTAAAVLYPAASEAAAIEAAVDVARTTLQSPVVLDVCRVWAATLLDALQGASKPALAHFHGPAMQRLAHRPLKPAVKQLLAGAAPAVERADALGVLQRAQTCFAAAQSFRDGMLQCVARPGASPTAAALYGTLAGAHFGIEAIPAEWRAKLADEAALRSLARRCAAG